MVRAGGGAIERAGEVVKGAHVMAAGLARRVSDAPNGLSGSGGRLKRRTSDALNVMRRSSRENLHRRTSDGRILGNDVVSSGNPPPRAKSSEVRVLR